MLIINFVYIFAAKKILVSDMPSNHNVKKASPGKQSETTYRHFALNDPCGDNMTSKVNCDNSHMTSKVAGGRHLHPVASDICNNNSTQFIEDHFKRLDQKVLNYNFLTY